MRLGEVDERPELLGARDRLRQIPLELPAVVSLEYLGVCPVEVGLGKEPVRDLYLAAKPFEQENRVGILLAHLGDYVLPCLRRNHVARIAAEAVHAEAAPEEEHLRHVRAKLRVRVVKLDEILPHDSPRAGRAEASVGFVAEPFWMVGLERRRPACVVGGKVDEEESLPRMHRAYELLELVEGRRRFVELRHRRIDREEIRRGEWTSVLAHHGVCSRHRERRQGLDDAKAHRAHYVVKTARDFAERPELAGEHAVYGIASPRLGAFHLNVEVGALRPFRDVGSLGEKARLAGKDADLVEANRRGKDAWRSLFQGDVRPCPSERSRALLGLGDYLPAPNVRMAEVRPKRSAPLARRI